MRIFLLLAFSLLFLATGCGGGNAKSKVKIVSKDPQEDPQKLVKDLAQALHQASEIEHFRESLGMVNAWLARNPGAAALDPKERKFLQEEAHLTGDEISELEAVPCPLTDAHHLASSYLFRDVAGKLDLAEAAALDKARAAFAWVIRRVNLHQQIDIDLPPALVLRRGHGSAVDRALVVLELLRALEVDAALIVDPRETNVLLGVLASPGPEKELFLFDPRLGKPLPDPKRQSVATLAQLKAQPELAKTAGWNAEAVKNLEVRAAVPLEALAPRWRNLEKELARQDKVRLAQPLGPLCDRLKEAAGGPVLVWNRPAGQGLLPNSPLRRARLFFPAEEGGLDNKKRWVEFQARLAPWTGVFMKYRVMNLAQDLLPEARETLTAISADLVNKFYLQPEDQFIRGNYEFVLDRLFRLRDEIETPLPFDEREFPRQVAQWREAVNDAYAAKRRQEPNAEARIAAIWKEDQFLLALVRLNMDMIPFRDKRQMVSHIVFAGCQEMLTQQISSLLADCWHEKAASKQVLVERLTAAGGKTEGLRTAASQAWDNARGARAKALERIRHSPDRLENIQGTWQRNDWLTAMGLWEEYHRDLHAGFRGRLLLAESYAHASKPDSRKQRLATLQQLHDDLGKWLHQGEIKKILTAHRDQAQIQKQSALVQRLDLLLQDWEPQGNLYWLRQTVQAELQN